MFTNNKNLKLFALSIIVGSAVMLFGGGQASAATLTVSGSCTLSEAITAINDADSGATGCNENGAYGTNDTITLPSGTTTVSADLPNITKTIVISGSSVSATTVDMGNNTGFSAQYNSNQNTKNFTIKNMSIVNSKDFAIKLVGILSASLENLDVSNSGEAIAIRETQEISIKNSLIHNNAGSNSGLGVGVTAQLGTYLADKELGIDVDGLRVIDNSGEMVGLYIEPLNYQLGTNDTELNGSTIVRIHNSVVSNNQARSASGILVVQGTGPASPNTVDISVDSTTVANNTVTVVDPQVVVGVSYLPVVSGFMFTGVLSSSQHFKNVTVAYNAVINPAPDNRNSLAGFLGSLGINGSNLNIINTTVVGNTVTQPSANSLIPAFFATKVGLNQNYQPISAETGSTATNVLIAQNKFNGQSYSCANNADTTILGFNLGSFDLTPTNLGHNMSDDQTCTAYTYVANLYDTIAHEVADNGGPVPTIKLLPGSPAINGGGQVLGITTDARGVVRDGYYSIGAYQGQLLAATTTTDNSTLAKTGMVIIIPSVILGAIILFALVYTFLDYRKHRKPLVQADPFARKTYTYGHHIKTVTIPVMRYRLHITINKNSSSFKKF